MNNVFYFRLMDFIHAKVGKFENENENALNVIKLSENSAREIFANNSIIALRYFDFLLKKSTFQITAINSDNQ